MRPCDLVCGTTYRGGSRTRLRLRRLDRITHHGRFASMAHFTELSEPQRGNDRLVGAVASMTVRSFAAWVRDVAAPPATPGNGGAA